jgi:hypothetical protein
MNLNYIHIGLDYYHYIEKNNKLRYEFQQYTSFICDYFSDSIRKLKFKTDGTFNSISIQLSEKDLKESSIIFDNVLNVELPFDQDRYENSKGSSDFSYYLEMLEKGFHKASEFKDIPLQDLLQIIEKFKYGGCKNEWIHKKKRFKEEDLEVVLKCSYTTHYFQLWLCVDRISTKNNLVNGVVLQTEVGVFIHQGMYKDIIINNNQIVITDKTDSPRIKINKSKISKNILDYKILGDKEIVEILSFKL